MEDSELASGAIALLLRETGHEVHITATVRDAIAACVTRRPDVMLLDLTLPDGDGLAVVTEARARGVAPRVTAALTGHDDPAVRDRCAAAGCAAVLTKPVPARELVRLVRAWAAMPP
ncbi:MAG: hypothetical protein NVS4B3_10100 [Gemmatimonadaceae bacterium]